MAGVPSWDCQGNWGIPGYLDKGGGGFQYFYHTAGVQSRDCQGNWGIPGYLDKGGGGSSTSTVWQEYRPGTVRVTGESRDTWTRGGGGGGRFQYFYCMAGVPSWDCQGNWGIPGYLDKGGEVPVLLLYGRSTVLGLSG